MFITVYSTIVLHRYSRDRIQKQNGEAKPPRSTLLCNLSANLLYQSGTLLGMGLSYAALAIDLTL